VMTQLGPEFTEAKQRPESLTLWLPGDGHAPWPSPQLASLLALEEPEEDPLPTKTSIPALGIDPLRAVPLLLAIEARLLTHDALGHGAGDTCVWAPSFRLWAAAARFALDLLEDQRVVPTLLQQRGGPLVAAWHPWLRDHRNGGRLAALATAMPGA